MTKFVYAPILKFKEGEIKGLSEDVDQEVKEAYDKFLIEGGYEF